MIQLNPRKLLYSKWTKLRVENKEKHFIVTDVIFDESVTPNHCITEAVISNAEYTVNWREFKNNRIWVMG